MKLRPVNDKIVVKPKEEKEDYKTESGIILPDTVDQGKLKEGEVIAVGTGMYSTRGTVIPPIVNVGDTILYNKNAQVQEYNGVVIMSQNEVLSVVEDKKTIKEVLNDTEKQQEN